MLVPFNFHDRDASRKSAQGVRVDLAGQNGGTAKAQFFGHHYEYGFVLDEVSRHPPLLGLIVNHQLTI